MKKLAIFIVVCTCVPGCVKMREGYIKYSEWAAETFDPQPEDSQKETPTPVPDSTYLSEIHWTLGPKGTTARITKEISDLKVSANGVSYKQQDVSDWSSSVNAKDGTLLHGVSCMVVFRDGKWQGGKFDWVRSNTSFRDFHNVKENYMKITPRSGEPFRFFIMNREGTEASNFLEGVYP
jgi:hypothetical protein